MIQDAKLGLIGFANDQAISLYRYYRRLTTPAGQAVQYTEQERTLLQALNIPFPGGLAQLGSFITGPILNAQLDRDVGITPFGGRSRSVLQPGEMITVTGHSLGGHLALLFGRFFPLVTEAVYTFNAPGILPQGDFILTNAGAPVFDPSRVTNVVANFGADFTAAIGTRPGMTHRVFNELRAGNATHNHSIVQLSDSLALYDLFGALSPALAGRIESITGILAAASAKPEESLERALDMLRLAVMQDDSDTPIAVANGDQAQRDAFYTRLYELRDGHDGSDLGITSLVGLPAVQLRSQRLALSELMPFAVPGATIDPSLWLLSSEWLGARADFLAGLIEARTLDQVFLPGSGARNVLFADVDRGERLALLSGQDLVTAQNLSFLPQELAAHIDGRTYAEKILFGSDTGADTLTGTAGNDRLFGGGGADVVLGLAGDDLLEGGAGADRLEGGEGFDTYVFASLGAGDRIADADGLGRIKVGSSVLGNGVERPDGTFVTADGAHVYELLGNVLRIDGLLELAGYQDGELGISLSLTPDEAEAGAQDFVHEFFHVNNAIQLLAGHDSAYGGPGDDLLIGGTGIDLLIGGRGDDILIAEERDHDLQMAFPPYVGVHIGEQLSGGEGNDLLIGSGRQDFLEGGAGSDFLFSGAGNDRLYGDGALVNRIFQEFFDEPLVAPDGSPATGDMLLPFLYDVHTSDGLPRAAPQYISTSGVLTPSLAASADVAGGGADEIDAGAGDDLVVAGRGDDRVWGGAGKDIIRGGDGNDALDGGDGEDQLFGEGGADRLDGGPGADRLHAGAGDVIVLRPGGNADTIVFEGSPSAVTVRVEGADDVVTNGTSITLRTHLDASLSFFPLSAQDVAGLQVEFADGHRTTFGELHARPSPPPAPTAPTAGNDTYTFRAGDGRHGIFDPGGADSLVIEGVATADVAVFSSGSDMLLRYPGGEVRLVAQAIAGVGVDSVRFTDATWTRSQLAAAAQALPPVDPIGLAVANPGEPFAYTVTQGAFGEQHTFGTPAIEVGTLNGAALPSWLSFDSGTGSFSGTPSAADAGVIPLMVALRDAGDVVAVTPLVIAVAEAAAAAESAAAPAVSEAATQVVQEAVIDLPAPIPLPATTTSADFPDSAVAEVTIPSSEPAVPERQSVGQIDDPVYERVDSLLSAPAAAHASSFVERYAEAIREFNERSGQSDPDAAPPPPPPTDEEMAAYNEALHSWLDADRARLAAAPSEESWDFGGWAGPFAASPGNPGGGVAVADQALARPGLPQPRAIHAAPGLAEGVGNLTL